MIRVSLFLPICLYVLLLAPHFVFPSALNVYVEMGDTGDLIPGAQDTGSDVGWVQGTLSFPGDVDLFLVRLGNSRVYQFDAISDPIDMNMHIFNSAGNPLAANDDFGGSLNSQIILNLPAGDYFVGVGDNNIEATDGAGTRISDNDSGVQVPSGVLGGWEGSGTTSGDTGSYEIHIIPEPRAWSSIVACLLLPLLPTAFRKRLAQLSLHPSRHRRSDQGD